MKKLVVLTVAALALALAGCGTKPSTPTAAPTTTTTIRLEPSDCGYRLTSWRSNDESARMFAAANASMRLKYGTSVNDAEEERQGRQAADDMVIAAHQIGCNWAAGAVVAGDRLIEFNPPPLALSGVVR